MSNPLREHQDAMDHCSQPLWVHLKRSIVMCNQPMLDLLGAKDVPQVVGRSPLDFVHPAFHDQAIDRFRRIEQGRLPITSAEARLVCLDGTEVDVEVAAAPYPMDGGIAIQAAFRDITEKRALGLRLREHAHLLDMAQVMIREANGRITSWSKGLQELYGWSPNEALGKVSHDLFRTVFPDSREVVEEALRKNGEWSGELVHWTRSGKRINVASHQVLVSDKLGQPVAVLEVNNDITALKLAEAEIRRLRGDAEKRALVLETARGVALDVLINREGAEVLRHIASAAKSLVAARYSAVGVANLEEGGLEQFVTVGLSEEQEAAIGSLPTGEGLLGVLLRQREPIRLSRISDHADSAGFPAHHPHMNSFLGVPICRGEQIIGSLYLTESLHGDFTAEDEAAVLALADYAAVAIHYQRVLASDRALVHGMITAQEEERRGIAYELHDGLTQYVMASHAFLQSFLVDWQKTNSSGDSSDLQKAISLLGSAVTESRRLVNGLRSLALDELGLAGAISQITAEEKERAGWKSIEFKENLGAQRFGAHLEAAVFRIVQEALTNARKHANADRVDIDLQLVAMPASADLQLVLRVADNGCGFDPGSRRSDYSHIGLPGMAERARLVFGTLRIVSASGAGTVIEAEFSVPASPNQSHVSRSAT